MFFPSIPIKTIDKANHSIDNPDRKMVALQNSGIIDKHAFDVFKLSKHGHRNYNHTVPSAFLAAFMVDKEHAFELAMSHLMADRMSNLMHDRLGASDKNVLEALINKQYEIMRATGAFSTGKVKKKHQKRMYY